MIRKINKQKNTSQFQSLRKLSMHLSTMKYVIWKCYLSVCLPVLTYNLFPLTAVQQYRVSLNFSSYEFHLPEQF